MVARHWPRWKMEIKSGGENAQAEFHLTAKPWEPVTVRSSPGYCISCPHRYPKMDWVDQVPGIRAILLRLGFWPRARSLQCIDAAASGRAAVSSCEIDISESSDTEYPERQFLHISILERSFIEKSEAAPIL